MLGQPVPRERRSYYEDTARKVAKRLRGFFAALKQLGETEEEFFDDPFSDVEEEIKMYWNRKRLDETGLKSIARLFKNDLAKLQRESCMGTDVVRQWRKWCPDIIKKLRKVVFMLYYLHRAVTKSDRLKNHIHGQLDASQFSRAIKNYSLRPTILKRIENMVDAILQ
ncbi:hypothetical protein Q1695_007844 [Nippostrongylus brasiliensis]|nr:hypothetical protein Q1695_007844 [Nippostrongylus brasiliensis]